MSSREDIDDFDLRLLALFELVEARESNCEPMTRRFLAIRALRRVLTSPRPTLAMAIESRRPPRRVDELRKPRDLRACEPYFLEAARRHDVTVEVITGERTVRAVVRARDEAMWLCTEAGVSNAAIARAGGWARHSVGRGIARHQGRVEAMAAVAVSAKTAGVNRG